MASEQDGREREGEKSLLTSVSPSTSTPLMNVEEGIGTTNRITITADVHNPQTLNDLTDFDSATTIMSSNRTSPMTTNETEIAEGDLIDLAPSEVVRPDEERPTNNTIFPEQINKSNRETESANSGRNTAEETFLAPRDISLSNYRLLSLPANEQSLNFQGFRQNVPEETFLAPRNIPSNNDRQTLSTKDDQPFARLPRFPDLSLGSRQRTFETTSMQSTDYRRQERERMFQENYGRELSAIRGLQSRGQTRMRSSRMRRGFVRGSRSRGGFITSTAARSFNQDQNFDEIDVISVREFGNVSEPRLDVGRNEQNLRERNDYRIGSSENDYLRNERIICENNSFERPSVQGPIRGVTQNENVREGTRKDNVSFDKRGSNDIRPANGMSQNEKANRERPQNDDFQWGPFERDARREMTGGESDDDEDRYGDEDRYMNGSRFANGRGRVQRSDRVRNEDRSNSRDVPERTNRGAHSDIEMERRQKSKSGRDVNSDVETMRKSEYERMKSEVREELRKELRRKKNKNVKKRVISSDESSEESDSDKEEFEICDEFDPTTSTGSREYYDLFPIPWNKYPTIGDGKLPKTNLLLEKNILMKFGNGKEISYSAWRAAFLSQIHRQKLPLNAKILSLVASLSDELKGWLAPKGEYTAMSYLTMIRRLEENYGGASNLIRESIGAVREMPTLKPDRMKDMENYRQKVETYLSCIKDAGRWSDRKAEITLHELIRPLPFAYHKEYQQYLKSSGKSESALSLKKWVDAKLKDMRAIYNRSVGGRNNQKTGGTSLLTEAQAEASSYPYHGTECPDEEREENPEENNWLCMVSNVMSTASKCPICSDESKAADHLLEDCKVISRLPVSGRKILFKGLDLCFKCGEKQHTAAKCPKNKRCKVCGKDSHHTLIHPNFKSFGPNDKRALLHDNATENEEQNDDQL